jgi:histidinol-phosphatase (PHP family)
MIPLDYHMHSNFSCDCNATMAEMCQSAIAKGIPEIGFTEHYDQHALDDCHDYFKPDAWLAELERCRAKFAGRLTIRAGIEIGEPHIFQQEARTILQSYPFDYALGSLHWIGNEIVFNSKFFQRPADEAFRLFFEELERVTRLGEFDILSHFEVLVRVGYTVYNEYDPRRYEDCIRPVLRNCIERGIALDINTAALRRTYAKPPADRTMLLTPGIQVLRWYAEMGGERITLGSDAHKPQDLGADLDIALNTAKAAGLKYITHFEKRQARLMPLP